MSAWIIQCNSCKSSTDPGNIAELLSRENGYVDEQGWFLCKPCGRRGYIKKEFNTQEGVPWEPYLQGVIQPKVYEGETYQPFGFLVSESSEKPPRHVWFCYYKDTRSTGGRLKMGHGPGGPPVYTADAVLELLMQMVRTGCLDRNKVIEVVQDA